jgi:hypothetical protein
VQLTTLTVEEAIGSVQSTKPEWGSVPDAVREGPCRSKIYQLVREKKIRSACLREPGKMRGKRLIHLQSLRDYIAAHEGLWSEKVPEKKGQNGGGDAST